ncbi:MAG: alkaline phosphatase [Planctomycetota bacterium]|nr:MAG: alkaline phosphatase [Planctomycetota bacterium]
MIPKSLARTFIAVGAGFFWAGSLLSIIAEETAKPSSADFLSNRQSEAIASKKDRRERIWHFGSQVAGDLYSNHMTHTNRLIPVYSFGSKVKLNAVSGINSLYRDPAKIKALYGYDAPNTLNPQADYFDQTDLYKVQKAAIEDGVKHMFVVWFDGMDWNTTQAAAVAKTGSLYTTGKGSGLIFQDYQARSGNRITAQYGYYVTSPSHDEADKVNVDKQTFEFGPDVVRGGYDAGIAGETPWDKGELADQLPGYLKAGGSADEKAKILKAGRSIHAFTDSSTSAASAFNGIKSYNNSLNMSPEGKPVRTLWHDLQKRGWKLGTATSVPFDHASPAATYVRNVFRDDYQDIAREMLGIRSVIVENQQGEHLPGLDVVLGAGVTKAENRFQHVKDQGVNAADGTRYLANVDKQSVDVKNGGPYVVVERTENASGKSILADAAERAARTGKRLFGVFGTQYGNLPYRTTDGDYRPAPGMRGLQKYTEGDLTENPTLADMTRASLKVLTAEKGKPFALFVEAGDVDFALHDNNLDSAIVAVYSGEDAIAVIIDRVEKNSDWNESAMIVTADHGHYLVVDDLPALAGHAAGKVDRREASGAGSKLNKAVAQP